VDYYPGRWDASAGGQVRSGETYAEAGTRELAEELGLEIEPGDLILVAKYDSYSERQREKRALFVCYSEGPFTADLQSIAELEFALAPEIDAMEPESFTGGFLRSFALWKKWHLRHEDGART
jgi:8-oxo-dGTP pyrophosphatase MutT (NUDIX family)